MKYYTEYPIGEFDCDSDEKALEATSARVVYRESNTPTGEPFIILRELPESKVREEMEIECARKLNRLPIIEDCRKNDVFAALVDAHLALQEVRRKLREAWQDGREYGRSNEKDGYPYSQGAREAMNIFLDKVEDENEM